MMRVLNAMLRIKEDEQVDIEKTSLLELNGVDMSYCSAKKILSMSLRSAFFFCSKTHDTMLGRSVAV